MLTAYNPKRTVPCKCVFTLLAGLLMFMQAWSQNDNCSNATNIAIANNGFAQGLYTSAIVDLTSATVEAGESFAPAIAAAGQTQKSIWFKFTLPTTRSLRVFLYETGGIVDGNVGLAVYKTTTCLPGNGDLSTKLMPITSFTSSFSDCVEGGQYLIQVSAKAAAAGQVYVRLQTAVPTSPYDVNWQAYYFGTLTADTASVSYEVSCQSLDDISEQCTALSNSQLYSKSTWNVFTTSSDLETILLNLSTQSAAAGQKIGFRLYEGDLRFSAATSLIASCDSLQTDGSGIASRSFTCGFLKPSTTYTFVLFFRNDFSETINISLISGPVVKTEEARICTGSGYKLPWGPVVTAPGTYSDTVKGKAGCDSLIQRVKVIFTNTPVIQNYNEAICSGGTYQLPWGPVVSLPGLYSDTLTASGGCDSLIRNITLGLKTTMYIDTTVGICTGQSYTLPWGDVVTATGEYSKTWSYVSGCDSLVTTVHLIQNKLTRDSAYVSVCGSQTFTLPWGQQADSSGVYQDTLPYQAGCDSLIRWVALTVKQASVKMDEAGMCAGGAYTLPWGEVVTLPGTYRDTVQANDGCDSIIMQVTLMLNKDTTVTNDVSICTGSSYTLPWGPVVTAAGTYRDTLRYTSGCDSMIRVINLAVNAPVLQSDSGFICSGQSYTLPWGGSVSAPGTYRDTVRAAAGCDSLVRMVTLSAGSVITVPSTVFLCNGGSYTLPWGPVITSAGVYRDTLHYGSGCDSVIREVTVTLNAPPTHTIDTTVCSGQSYILSSGAVADTTGLYRDTLKAVSGCDSLIRLVNLTVKTKTTETFHASVCPGTSFTLPWGSTATAPGIYRDTLFYTTGCDSVIREVHLATPPAAVLVKDEAIICKGQSYNLPWGGTADTTGRYSDTLRYSSGCDSLITVIELRVVAPVSDSINASFCSGKTYTLPWGAMVSASGIYKDTLRSVGGCDSLVRVVTLTENEVALVTDSVSFCAGGKFTLPWGPVINTPGTYTDTVRHLSGGCDSVIRKIIARVNTTAIRTIDTVICSSQAYTLPSGVLVSAGGIYRDTLKATGGCDSVVYTVDLTVNKALTSTLDTTIAAGATYVLPWGTAVTARGTYSDTVRYPSGCDSLVRMVNLTVSDLPATTLSATICDGQHYVLPWGPAVSTAGSYTDTLKNAAGRDSAIVIVDLGVQTALLQASSVSICKGQSYTLPWGVNVVTPGLYADTLRYQSGCDSLIRSVELQFKGSSEEHTTVPICPGQSYILPWGTTVTSPGLYSDTLRYREGCDSIIRNVTLEWMNAATLTTSATICYGQSFTLPWGRVVNAPGTYSDTLFSRSGCDSVVRIIQLSSVRAVQQNTTASICDGQSYSLPWGGVARTGGIYRDTVRSRGGCDSLIQTLTLTVNPAPLTSLGKSNDVDCMLGSSKLSATGGTAYRWWPSESLSDSLSSHPVATPSASTMYHVQVSSGNGCVAEDSILVNVAIGNPGNGYLVPNAFTPDGDGLNDCFGVQHWGAVSHLNFTIYNRWGEIVFQTTDSNRCWNGTYKNSKLPTGTFVYLISAKRNRNAYQVRPETYF